MTNVASWIEGEDGRLWVGAEGEKGSLTTPIGGFIVMELGGRVRGSGSVG